MDAVVALHIAVTVDLAARTVLGTAKLQLPPSCLEASGDNSALRIARFCFRGGRITRVLVCGTPASFTQQHDTFAVALAHAQPELGLEAITAALRTSTTIPADASIVVASSPARTADGVELTIDYELISHAQGGIVTFADADVADGGGRYCWTTPQDVCGPTPVSALFPHLPGMNWRYGGRLIVHAVDNVSHGRRPLVCVASGNAVPPASTLPGQNSLLAADAWEWTLPMPLPAAAIGFILGPLHRVSAGDLYAEHWYSGPEARRAASATQTRLQQRVVAWMSAYLGAPFPAETHRHVFLPESVLPFASALAATPTGLAPPTSTAACGGLLASEPLLDVGVLGGGVAFMPDGMLSDGAVVDADAAVHRAIVYGVARSWFGGAFTGCDGWHDAWLAVGLAGYVAAQYTRTIRGEAEARLDLSRAAEVVAALEEATPSLTALWPRGLAARDAVGGGWGHPMRARYVLAKAPLAVHMLAERVGGDQRFSLALRLLARKAVSLPVALSEVEASLGSIPRGVTSTDAPSMSDPLQPSSSTAQQHDSGKVVAEMLRRTAALGATVPVTAFLDVAALVAAAQTGVDGASIAHVAAAQVDAGSGTSRAGADHIEARVTGHREARPTAVIAATADIADFASQWLSGVGMPHFTIGLHYDRHSNALDVVVEQIPRLSSPFGRARVEGGSHERPFFSGDLVVYVAERPEVSADEEAVGDEEGAAAAVAAAGGAPPEVWAHKLRLTGAVRERITLPCHGKPVGGALAAAQAAAAVADALAADLSRKGRGMGGASRLDPTAQLAEAHARRAAVAAATRRDVALEDVNDSPICWVAIDPQCAWPLRHTILLAPPVWLLGTLSASGDASARIAALNAIGLRGAPDAVYVAAPNSSVVADLKPVDAFPSLADGDLEVIDRKASVRRALRSAIGPGAIRGAGALLHPQRGAPIPLALAAVILDADPGAAGRGGDGDVFAALTTTEVSASVTPKATQRTIAPPPALQFGFRVRGAAAAALARWASGHLPADPGGGDAPPQPTPAPVVRDFDDGDSAQRDAEAAAEVVAAATLPCRSYAGLAMLLYVYKRLFFEQSDADMGFPSRALEALPTPGLSAPPGATLAAAVAAYAAESSSAANELLAYARSGTPRSVSVASLAHFSVRQALIAAIGGVRGPGGGAPPASRAFLIALLRGYVPDNSSAADDTPLLATLVLSLASATLDSRDNDAAMDSDAAAAIRETFALELALTMPKPPPKAASMAAGDAASWAAGDISSVPVHARVHDARHRAVHDDTGDISMGAVDSMQGATRHQKRHRSGSIGGGANVDRQRSDASHPNANTLVRRGWSAARATRGTVIAACITALSLLEASGRGRRGVNGLPSAPLLLTLLRNFVSRVHRVRCSPRGVTETPARVRLSAFVALTRAYLVFDTACSDTAWLQRAVELIEVPLALAGATDGDGNVEPVPIRRALAAAMFDALCTLQYRTDTAHGAAAPRRPWLLQRFNAEVEAAFSQAPKPHDLALRSTINAASAYNVGKASRNWRLLHAVLDLGLTDGTADVQSRLTVHERRAYGLLRAAPSSYGFLSRMNIPPADRAAAAVVACIRGLLRRVSEELLRPPCARPLVAAMWGFVHSVWGALPPTPLLTSMQQQAHVIADETLSSAIAALTRERRTWIAAAHADMRSRQCTYRRLMLQGALIREMTAGVDVINVDEYMDDSDDDSDDPGV